MPPLPYGTIRKWNTAFKEEQGRKKAKWVRWSKVFRIDSSKNLGDQFVYDNVERLFFRIFSSCQAGKYWIIPLKWLIPTLRAANTGNFGGGILLTDDWHSSARISILKRSFWIILLLSFLKKLFLPILPYLWQDQRNLVNQFFNCNSWAKNECLMTAIVIKSHRTFLLFHIP